MSLILSGTDGLSDVDGSAATPAIRGTDTNTGIFFPAADTVGISTGGTERARVDSAGNAGLGVTPSAWASTYRMLQIGYGASVGGRTAAAQAYLSANWYTDGTANKYIYNGYATQYQQDAGAHYWFNAASGTAGNAITFTQAMTLTAAGDLGIGTTSPNGRIQAVAAASTDCVLRLNTSTNAYASGVSLIATDSNGARFNFINASYGATENWYIGGNGVDKTLVFKTDSTERARINSNGDFLVGTTTANAKIVVEGNGGYSYNSIFTQASSTGNVMGIFGPTNGTTQNLVVFAQAGNVKGTISTNGSTTSYNTSSDYRLKENIAPMTGALATVTQLKPCTYTWKATGQSSQGFIAHELQAVVPDAVTGEKDAVNEDGSIKPQGIDTSFLVATLTAAIQEQQAIITQLQADVAALKGNA